MLKVVPAGDGDEGAAGSPSLEHVSTQLSALLAELVRAQEVEIPQGFTPELKAGSSMGRFKLLRELGRGGFGVVYEALDGELSRTVALKVVRPGTRIAARGTQWLLREAEAVARLNHPNIITLHDFGQGPGGPYLVFELLRGQSLAERLRKRATLPPEEVIDLGLAIARALVHAHAAGVVHRDLTAGNVHLGEDGAVKVLDFGLAHLFGRDGANDGGTPAYMAPEQWEGNEDGERTDLFALGVILFQALSGGYPYKVEKGWSEALEPGPTPRLPRSAGPRPLRRLVRSLLERDPDLRPEHAKAVRDQLLALRRARDGAGRQRAIWGLGAVAAVAVLLAGWLYTRHEPPPGEQVQVVMAAMENGAGEPTLEAVPGLLAAALEPSQRVRLVPPSRLAYASRQAGLGPPGRLDAEAARSLARLAGAAVVLVPSAWLEEARPVVGVRAVESETGQPLFTARGAPGKGRPLSAVVDQLSDQIRRELKERTADRKLRRPVAELVTASPEAARWYYQGVDCLARRRQSNGNVQQCEPDFDRALSFDPTFPLAHYQLAAASYALSGAEADTRSHVEAAQRLVPRLPPREAQLLRALSLRIDGRAEQALQLYQELLASAPEDPELLGLASDLQAGRGDWSEAARVLEKLVVVAPDQEQPLLVLIEALGRLNRAADLQGLQQRLGSATPRRWRASVEASLWLGRPEEALATARRAVVEAGDAEVGTLFYALQAAGEFGEMEELAARQVAAEPAAVLARRRMETALIGQGRIAEALRWADSSSPLLPQAAATTIAYRQAMIVASSRDPRRMWPYAARAFALDQGFAADLAVVLALSGDLRHSEELARTLPAGSPEAEEYAALGEWRAGDFAAASARLARLEARDPWPANGLAPSYLLAELSAAEGDAPGVLAAVAKFRRLPAYRLWQAWAFPRALYLEAAAHQQLGDGAAARERLDRLLRMLARAERSFPLLVQARGLRERL